MNIAGKVAEATHNATLRATSDATEWATRDDAFWRAYSPFFRGTYRATDATESAVRHVVSGI